MMEPLIDYIPYSRSSETKNSSALSKAIKTILFLLKESLNSITAYKEKKYHLFDPQVGENLCQIRAFKNFLLFESNPDCFFLKKNIEQIHEYIFRVEKLNESAIKNIRHEKNINTKNKNIRDYLQEKLSDIKFNETIEYLTFSFILTKYSVLNEESIPIGLNYNAISKELDVHSTTYASKLVHKLQRNISLKSTELIFRLIEKNNYKEYFWNMIKYFYQKDEVLRHVLPCYFVTNIILDHITFFYRDSPIIFKIKFNDKSTLILPFHLNESGFHYDKSILEKYTNKPCIIFEGIIDETKKGNKTQAISAFLEADLLDIIKMNMAAHPQYSGKKLEKLKFNPFLINSNNQTDLNEDTKSQLLFEETQFLKDKNQASHRGCSADNASLYLIKHIYCDSPQHLLNSLITEPLPNLTKNYFHLISQA